MSKCTCEEGVDGVDQAKMAVDQVKQMQGPEVIRWSRMDYDTCVEIVEEA
jgi:hypothetical protein